MADDDKSKPTTQAATTAAQGSTATEEARQAGVDPATGQPLSEEDVRRAQDAERGQQGTASEDEELRQAGTSEGAETATAEGGENPLEGTNEAEGETFSATDVDQSESGDADGDQPGNESSPWANDRTHDEVNKHLGDRSEPEGWDDMTIRQKKEWLDANA